MDPFNLISNGEVQKFEDWVLQGINANINIRDCEGGEDLSILGIPIFVFANFGFSDGSSSCD